MSLTKKQELFAQAVLTESTLSNAYRVAYDCENMSSKAINVNASKLANRTKVALRVQALKKQQEIDAETDESGLTEKQHKFVDSYLKSGCYSDAYREAYDCDGMSPKTINNRAYELSQNGEITGRISKLKARIQAENKLTHEKITERLSAIAFSTIKDIYDKNGKIIHPSEMTTEQAVIIKKYEESFVEEENKDGEAVLSKLTKIETHDLLKAIDMLARHVGYYEKDHEQASQMSKSWDELESIHQELMQEMRDDKKRLEGRGVRIELALSQGLDIESLDFPVDDA